MGKGSSNTTTTTSKPPQIYLDAYRALMGQAQQVATQPLQQYQGDIVAGFSPAQQSAFDTVNNAQGMGMPYINAAMGYTQDSTNPLNYASLNSGQLGNLAGGSMDYFNQAGQGTNVPGLDVQSYMNPYTQDVINSSLGLMDQQNQQQQSQLQGDAISKGAWGGDRAGIAQNDLAQKQQLAKQQMVSQLNNQNYSQALGAAQQQQGLGVQTGLADAQRQAGLAQQGLGAFGQQGQLGLAGDQAQAYLNSNAASQLGQFGQEAFNQALTGAQSQLGIGNLQQQLQQAYMNVPYQMFLQQQAYPFQTTGWLGNLTEGLGSQSGGTSSTTAPGASTGSQILGGLGAIGGLAGGMSGKGSAGGASTGPGNARGGRIGYAPGGVVMGGGMGNSANGKGSMMSGLPMFANGQMLPSGRPGAGGNGFMSPQMFSPGGSVGMILDPNTGGLLGEGDGGLSDSVSFAPNPAGKGPPLETSQTSSGGGGKGIGDIIKTGASIGMMLFKNGGRTFNFADGGAVDIREQLMAHAGDRAAQAAMMKKSSFGGGGKANGVAGTYDDPWSGWLNTYMQGSPTSGGMGSTGNLGKGAQLGQDATSLVGDFFGGLGKGSQWKKGTTPAASPGSTPAWLQRLVPDSLKNARNSNPANVPNYAQMGVGSAAPTQATGVPSNLANILHGQGAPGYAGGGSMIDVDPTGEGDFQTMPMPDPGMPPDPLDRPLPVSSMDGFIPKPNGQDVLLQALNGARGGMGMKPLTPDFKDDSKNSPSFEHFMARILRGPFSGDQAQASTMHGSGPPAAPQGIGGQPPPNRYAHTALGMGPPQLGPPTPSDVEPHHLPHDRTGTGHPNDVLPAMESGGGDWWSKFQKSPWFLLADAGARTLAGQSPNAGENIGAGISGALGDYTKERQSAADMEARRMMEDARNQHEDRRLDNEERRLGMQEGDKDSLKSKRLQEQLASFNKMYNDNLFAKPGEDDKVGLASWTQRQQDLAKRMAQVSDQLMGVGAEPAAAAAAAPDKIAATVAPLKDGKPHKLPNGKTVQYANGKWIVS